MLATIFNQRTLVYCEGLQLNKEIGLSANVNTTASHVTSERGNSQHFPLPNKTKRH